MYHQNHIPPPNYLPLHIINSNTSPNVIKNRIHLFAIRQSTSHLIPTINPQSIQPVSTCTPGLTISNTGYVVPVRRAMANAVSAELFSRSGRTVSLNRSVHIVARQSETVAAMCSGV